MDARERGVALVFVLMLLTVTSLLATIGIQQAITDERIAGNQRQASEAFLAAEIGLLRAADWWQRPIGESRNDQLYWNDRDGALAALNALEREPRPGLHWFIEELEFQGDEVVITSLGQVVGSGTVREINARYLRPSTNALDGLAPLVLGASVAEFRVSEGADPRMQAGIGNEPAPMIQIVNAEDTGSIRSAIAQSVKHPSSIGIEVNDLASDLLDPAVLQRFVEAVADSPEAYDGSVPWGFGTVETPAITVVRGLNGERSDLRLSTSVSGVGVLIVSGDLYVEDVLDFTGLIMVLGGSLEMGGDSGRIQGSILVQGIEEQDPDTWGMSPDGLRVTLAGELDFEHSREALASAWDLLPAAARAVWEDLDGVLPQGLASGRLFDWSESLRL